MFNLVVKVGSYKTSICKANIGVVLEERSLIAVEPYTKEIVALGTNATQLLNSNTKYLPLAVTQKGVIKNRKHLSFMLQAFFDKLFPPRLFKKHSLIFCIPICLTASEKTEIKNLAYSLNVKKVKLIPGAVMTYVLACYDSFITTKIILNIGGDKTEISLVYDTKILTGFSIGIGGNDFDKLIKDIILDKYKVDVSITDAEILKREIATLLPNDNITTTIKGKSTTSEEDVEITVHSQDFKDGVAKLFEKIVQPLEAMKNSLTNDLVSELEKGGVFVCGGMANITGIERLIKSRLNLPAVVPSFPENVVMQGAEIVLNSPKIMDKVLSNNL